MIFTSLFSDYNNKQYGVEINATETMGKNTKITMGGNPCVISTASGKLFDPIKSRSCSLEFVTDTWYFQLYEPKSRGTKVKVYEYDSSYPYGVKKVIFKGYLTPAAYNQDWTYLDTISLEAVDALSTTKDFDYVADGKYHTFIDIILNILKDADYDGNLYVPQTYTHINGESITGDVLDKILVSSANFIDDDDARTPWKQYDVLFEIMQYLNWSMVPDGENVYCVDYRALGKNTPIVYSKYDIQSKSYVGTEPLLDPSIVNINLDNTAAGTTSVSIDDVYNKIEISDNLYKIDEISPDIFDDGNHISVTEEIQKKENTDNIESNKWIKKSTKGWWFWKKSKETVTGYNYQTLCRLKRASGWKHFYYRMDRLENNSEPIEEPYPYNEETDTRYYQPYSGSIYTAGLTNKYVNTHCCLLQHYAFVKENANYFPPSLDWTDVLTFFVTNDTVNQHDGVKGKINGNYISNYEKKVLEYTIDESILWQPRTGVSWITIAGDLYYQYNGEKYGDKDKNTLNTINEKLKYYITSPVDKLPDHPDDVDYMNVKVIKAWVGEELYKKYMKGFACWRMRLQIGEGNDAKYWNGTSWTSNPSDFYIKYNNGPEDGDPISIPAFQWVSPVNNNDFRDKVGVDGYAIPIEAYKQNPRDYKYGVPPKQGKLILSIYTPCLLPEGFKQLMQDIFKAELNYNTVDWKDLPNVIYAKGFEVGYVYTDTGVWWNNHSNNNKADKVYVGNIDDNYVKNFDRLEFKINTPSEDQPISRSYVTTSTTDSYVTSMKHKNGDSNKEQEFNVVDAYLDHHSERKPIIETNIHGLAAPNAKYLKNMIEGMYVLDSQSYDVRRNNNRIKIISF